jgi:hypothetical protein
VPYGWRGVGFAEDPVGWLDARRGAAAIPLGSSSGAGSVALGIAVHTLTASFAALTFALLYFDLLARVTKPAARSTPEYQHLRDLD